ncbi:MAG: XRE family transcriptional regulator [Alphaproteobacteria bacterium]
MEKTPADQQTRPVRSFTTLDSESGDTEETAFDGSLGAQLRELRKVRDFSLAMLAEQTGLSVGHLSQIERNLSSPSVKALHDIANALGVNISWFFQDETVAARPERAYIVRAAERRILHFSSDISDELLSPNLSGQLELLWSRFAPGSTSGVEPYRHKGEEAGVVISGTLELWIGDTRHILHKGDSFSFKSTLPHRYSNPGDEPTDVVWAITPPSY